MIKKSEQLKAMFAALFLVPFAVNAQSPRVLLELEGGAAWQSYNDVQIPNNASSTRFSLRDVAGGGPWPAGRAYLTWNVNDRHGLRLLAAPFSITEDGTSAEPISFAGANYSALQPLRATYTFNSYRVSYRYRFRATEQTKAWVGFTAKLRDAQVKLVQGSVTSQKDDLGFVPLLHFAVERKVADKWQVDFDADALAGGPGRAVDASLKLGYDPGGAWMVRAGYRTVEGGADVDEVYSFAWLHYGVASLVWRW
jgi:hypothetical protein